MAAPAKKITKSKMFRIATEGATVDGRTIERAWIKDMVDTYDPAVYHATINMEHIKGLLPDGPFRNYGFVNALSAVETDKGKLQLLAEIAPTAELIAMTQKGQKVFTSIEVNPKFADTGKAYLVGLAVTDNPASLGTEMLKFSASHPEASPLTRRKQDPGNYFSEAIEAHIEFIEEAPKSSVLAKVKALFARRADAEDQRYNDLTAAIEEVAEHGEAQSTQTAQRFETVDAQVKQGAQDLRDLTQRLDALERDFDHTAAPRANRPRADGHSEVLTEF
jgi:hypothetical protein